MLLTTGIKIDHCKSLAQNTLTRITQLIDSLIYHSGDVNFARDRDQI